MPSNDHTFVTVREGCTNRSLNNVQLKQCIMSYFAGFFGLVCPLFPARKNPGKRFHAHRETRGGRDGATCCREGLRREDDPSASARDGPVSGPLARHQKVGHDRPIRDPSAQKSRAASMADGPSKIGTVTIGEEPRPSPKRKRSRVGRFTCRSGAGLAPLPWQGAGRLY